MTTTLTQLRISRQDKDIISHRIASNWIKFARRILSEGGKPAKLSKTAKDSVWCEIVRRYGEELAITVSHRTISGIVKETMGEARWLVAFRRLEE